MGSCGGRANQVLGVAVLSRGTSARVPGQSETYRDSGNSGHKMELIVAEIGDDEGILGNDFTTAHELTVRPCEGAMYLPDGTEETLAVRAVGPATLAPHTVTQVRVIVPTPRARGRVMIEMGPGPLGLCPVQGVVEVEKDSSIWLANTGTQPIHIEQNEVVAMAECVMAGPGTNPRSGPGLVERAAPHLPDEECQQLRAAMAARKHLFAARKGDLGRTDIIQHQIHMGDQPAIKQRVGRYPAARWEEERQLVEDMLAIGIIQESNSEWSSPTVLVKKKDETTRFCIDYRRLNQVTKVDAYPLLYIEESLTPSAAQGFSVASTWLADTGI